MINKKIYMKEELPIFTDYANYPILETYNAMQNPWMNEWITVRNKTVINNKNILKVENIEFFPAVMAKFWALLKFMHNLCVLV